MDKKNAYDTFSLSQLKSELQKRGYKTSGRKKDLVARLQALDIMGVSGARETLDVEYHIDLPDISTYSDINANTPLPAVTMNRILSYFSINDKEFESKYRHLYDEGYVRYMRFSQGMNQSFIMGNVWAEMKKSVSYKVDVVLHEHQVITEAQCVCAVGQGPTAQCKHVACVLYGLHSFSKTSYIHTEQTCTQVLQTFHHTKPYRGSPMTAKDVQEVRKQNFVYDPRPIEYRNQAEYTEFFRNHVINYQGANKMPVLQLYKPANPFAINNDHDYEMSCEDAFLKRNKLCEITDEDITIIETRTRANVRSWRKERNLRITSSNYGKICKSTSKRNMKLLASDFISPRPFRSRATDYEKNHGTGSD